MTLTKEFCEKRISEQETYLSELLDKFANDKSMTKERFLEIFESAYHRLQFFKREHKKFSKKIKCLCHPNDLIPFGDCVYGKCLDKSNTK